MNILHLDSSALGDASVSRRLTARVVADVTAAAPGATVVRRDLAAEPIGHLSGAVLGAMRADPADLDPASAVERTLTDTLIAELLAADLIVIGAPMYNFGIPTQLKSWIDRVAVAGRTFRYTESGPEGLAGGRKVVIASSRGSIYQDEALNTALDHQEAHLRAVFGLIGITDVTVIRAEGIGLGPDARTKAIESAEARIDGLFSKAA